jgi:hypothetical protein
MGRAFGRGPRHHSPEPLRLRKYDFGYWSITAGSTTIHPEDLLMTRTHIKSEAFAKITGYPNECLLLRSVRH